MNNESYFWVYYNPPYAMPLYLRPDGGFSVHTYQALVCKTPEALAEALSLVSRHGVPHWVASDWQP